MRTLSVQTEQYKCSFFDNGVIYSLVVNGIGELIPADNGWGCELGNWESFFSQLKHLKDEAKIIHQAENEYCFTFDAELKHPNGQVGRFDITEKLVFTDTTIIQEYTFVVASTIAKLGDLVSRCVFDATVLPQGSIAGREFKHRDQNRYYQYPLTDVSITGGCTGIIVQTQPMSVPPGHKQAFQQTSYLRGEPALPGSSPAWVIHSRLIAEPEMADNYTARWFYPNRILPMWLTAILALRPLRPFFWRLRERHPLSPVSLGSFICVAKGDTFTISTAIQISVEK